MSQVGILLFLFSVFGVLLTDLGLLIRGAVKKKAAPDKDTGIGWWGNVQIMTAFSVSATNAVSQPVGSLNDIRFWTQLIIAIIVFFGWPALIAYLVFGRKKRRNYRKFARLFLWLSVFHPIIVLRLTAEISAATLVPATQRLCKRVDV